MSTRTAVAAVVLAGGHGSRLAPWTDHLPKPLVPAANRLAVSYSLELLARSGIRDVAVVYVDPRVRSWVERAWAGEFDFVWVLERERKGTGGALTDLPRDFRDRHLVVLAADMVNTVDLEALVAAHLDSRADISLACAWAPAEIWEGDIVEVGAERLVTRYGPMTSGLPEGEEVLGSVGLQVLAPGRVWSLLPDDTFTHLSDDVLPAAVARGFAVGCFVTPQFPWDFGYPDELHEGACLLLTDEFAPLFAFDPGGPYVDPDARVHAEATLVGPVHVAAGAQVDAGVSVVGPSTIGHGAHVGAGAHIERVVVMPGHRVPAGARLADTLAGTPSDVEGALTHWLERRPDAIRSWTPPGSTCGAQGTT